MDSRLVEYLTWFKENEKGMNDSNNLANSSVSATENVVINFLRNPRFPERINIHDPWWHPTLIELLKKQYQITAGRELVITNGASGAIWLVFQALLSPGDHVIVESPVYQPLLSVPMYLNAEISRLERKPEENYQIVRNRLESLLRPNTRLIVLTDLHNPSGYPLGVGVLDWLKEIARESGGRIKVLIDETFRDLAPGERSTAANLDESFISINTLSKTYGLATLRCGWIVSSQETYRAIRDTFVLVENSGSPIAESAASIALEHLESHQSRAKSICAENLRLVNEIMTPLLLEGWISGEVPEYGCLYFPRISRMEDTEQFTRELRDSWDVYVVPGRFFEAPQHIRIGFGGTPKNVLGKLNRLAAAIRSRTFSMS